MVDKLNRINVNINNVQGDMQQRARKEEAEQKEVKEQEQIRAEHKHVDPDKLMDAMKKHGLHNLNHVMASGKVASKTISDAINYFTDAISPQKHAEITNKVCEVFKQEFPGAKLDRDVVEEVVDNLIFDALTA
jgi:capsular polysaccharide biosynthesis protein